MAAAHVGAMLTHSLRSGQAPATTPRALTGDEQRDIEQLIYHEAALIDQRRFDEWLELFTDEAIYWIPNNSGDSNPAEEGPIVHEDRRAMSLRVARLQHPAALTQIPPPRTAHFITNVAVTPDIGEECLVTSNQLVYFVRGDMEIQYPGSWEHSLGRENGQWRIAQKKVCLLTNNRPLLAIPLL